ncbi:hypothetical protein T492DRAFT_339063 [Pavlovales sp. CCMP2436]|nr:hypothetical protein T492DRAFT_339063 [Pavlovales sp. CCMP2436]
MSEGAAAEAALLVSAAQAFLARPVRQQRRLLERLTEAASNEAASAAELKALWAVLPEGARAALLARTPGCGCGALAGEFGPRLTQACACCGAELHAPCLGLRAPPRALRKRRLVDGAAFDLDATAAGAEAGADCSADQEQAPNDDWSARCSCARRAEQPANGSHALSSEPAGSSVGGAGWSVGAAGDGAAVAAALSEAAVAERVALLACAFGAGGVPATDEHEPLADRLRPPARARLAAYGRAWLRCLLAAAPPMEGLKGLRALLGAPLLAHYERRSDCARDTEQGR